MAYDAMGYYIGDYDPYAEQLQRLEEERKKREKLLDTTPVQTQQSTTYANGSQTHKTTTEVPAPAAQPAYQAPPPPPVAQAQPVTAPVVPDQQQYNASIAQQESGANPTIGYHDQSKSSAYGTYGITSGAYADARKLNPNLPADIAQASPEQQNQAMNAFTAQNARYLKNYGVEPTQQNLQAAHFLGAKGLSDYLRDGTVSPAAAAANGGEDKVRQIVNARLGGQPAAASGAVNQPQTQSAINTETGETYQQLVPTAQAQPQAQPVTAPINPMQPQLSIDDYGNRTITNPDGSRQTVDPQGRALIAGGQEPADTAQYKARLLADGLNDPGKAYQIYQNPKQYGEAASVAAGKQVYDSMKQNQLSAQADEELKKYAAGAMSGNPADSRKIADIFNNKDKSELGGYMKMALTHLFFGQAAGQRYGEENLGHGTRWEQAEITNDDGTKRSVAVQLSANGRPVSGIDIASNKALSTTEIGQALVGYLPKGVHVTKVESLIDPKTGVEVNRQTLSNGKERYMKGGVQYSGDLSTFTAADEYNKNIDIKIRQIDSQLASKYSAGPTPEQRANALRQGGIPARVIEQQMGMPEGSMAGSNRTPATTTAPASAPATAPATAPAAKPAVGSTVLPSGKPFDPNGPPVPPPGQLKSVTDADTKAWTERNKLYVKQVDSIADVRNKAEKDLAVITNLLRAEGLPGIVGLTGAFPSIPGGKAADAQALLDTVKGGSFLTAIQGMKGFGALSNVEGDKAQSAIAALSQKQSEAEFKKNLIEYANTIKRSVNTFESKIGEPPTYDVPKAGASNSTSDVQKRADAIIGK